MRVIFSPKFEGLFKATLELVFYHSRRSARFVVHRTLQGTAGSPEDHRYLSLDHEDYDGPAEKSLGTPPRKIILCSPPEQPQESKYIPDYEVPPIVQQAVDISTATRPYDKIAPDLVSTLRPDSLIMNTYAHYFEALLNVEDGHRQYVHSGRWDVLCQLENDANIRRCGQRYR